VTGASLTLPEHPLWHIFGVTSHWLPFWVRLPRSQDAHPGSACAWARQDDTQAAVVFAEGEIRRLLSGRVYLSDLVMTGGLWRITGQQARPGSARAPLPRRPPDAQPCICAWRAFAGL